MVITTSSRLLSLKTGYKIEKMIIKSLLCPLCGQNLTKCSVNNSSWRDCFCHNGHTFEIKTKAFSPLKRQKNFKKDIDIFFRCGNPSSLSGIDGIIYYIYNLDSFTDMKQKILFGFLPVKEIKIEEYKEKKYNIIDSYMNLKKGEIVCPPSLKIIY